MTVAELVENTLQYIIVHGHNGSIDQYNYAFVYNSAAENNIIKRNQTFLYLTTPSTRTRVNV